MKSVLNIHWKDWCWSWNSNTVATWCKELPPWKRPWCWERLKVGGQGNNRGWDSWMASLTQWTWVSVNFGNWWWTGRPGVLQSVGLQSIGHDWATEPNWTKSGRLRTVLAVVVVSFVKVEKREKKRTELRNIKRKHKRIWCQILHSIS